jgi:uncharacterized protein YndB with AHSA1/START domain
MTDAAKPARDRARTIVLDLDIKASPEDVWRALTDAAELVRWFPLQARVTPGPGGTIRWAWDDAWSTEASIATWTPPRRLVLTEERPAFDADGAPVPGSRVARMTMEFTIEALGGGTTRLRLVHSGFGTDAGWDDEIDSTSAGWNVELRGLKDYLERHQGHDRVYAKAQCATSIASDDVWRRLLSPSGFRVMGGRLEQGEQCTLHTPWGDEIAGSVVWIQSGWDILMSVEALNQGLFRLSTWRAPGQTGVQIWLTAYDPAYASDLQTFAQKANAFLGKILNKRSGDQEDGRDTQHS